MKKILMRLTLVLLIFIFMASGAYFIRDSNYYPYVVINSPEGLTLTYLRNGPLAGKSCEESAEAIVIVMQANCLACNVSKQQCLTKLPPDLHEMLSEQAIVTPSLRIPDGTISFNHPDQQVALDTCLESQRLASASEKQIPVTCHPANTLRPFPDSKKQAGEMVKSIAGALSRIFLVLCLAIALFSIVKKLTARSPAEGIEVDMPHQ